MGNAKFDFGRKVLLLTGGASLLGAAIARTFHAAGAAVSIADVDAARGGAVAAALGERALFTRCDVTDDAALEALVEATCERFGGVPTRWGARCRTGPASGPAPPRSRCSMPAICGSTSTAPPSCS